MYIHTLLVLLYTTTTVTSLDVEVDVSWDFNAGVLDGWANATSEEMGIETRVEDGELRASINQWNPHFNSPTMFIQTTNRHYCVLRMMYFGGATNGNMLMKYGPSLPHRQNIDELKSTWRKPQALLVVGESGVNSTGAYAVDNSLHTAWHTESASRGAWIIIDTQDFRWITAITIKSSGDENSPKRCLLQQSVTSGSGPFVTVKDFTLAQTFDNQTIMGFSKQSRYWKLIVLTNYGGDSIAIRDIGLEGYDEGVSVLPFEIDNTGTYKNYYLTIHDYLMGPLVQLRFEFFHTMKAEHLSRKSRPNFREALAIDYVRIVRAPEILKVRGCLDKYFDNPNQNFPNYNVAEKELVINGQLPIRYFTKNSYDEFRYASTYDCPHAGGIELRVDGVNLGLSPKVFIDDNECVVTFVGSDFEAGSREGYVLCTLPASAAYKANGNNINSDEVLPSIVRVESSTLPGLFENRPYFTYRKASPAPARPVITNIGARRVDIVWTPPGDVFDTMMTTGYKIIWFQAKYRTRVSNVTVGNVTTTSIRGLEPGTSYVFGVSALSEGAAQNAAILPTDLYGRRAVNYGAMESPVSIFTNITATLANDFDFSWFDGNMTLNNSGATYSNSNGPTGLYGSEGNYGLTIVGSAHVENCNASMTCCDGYNETLGLASCGTGRTVCAVLLERRLAYEYVYDGISRRQVPSNRPYDDGAPPEKVILTLEELIAVQGAEMPSMPCGPALRLTPSAARESGAVWYPRKMNVREGFETTISYQISNPSMRCNRLDDVNTYCRSRGADGLAFVLQDSSPVALGLAGGGLGYEGINNSLAVEIDTFFNFDQMDYYENHVAVMTQGRSLNITANHSRSLATATRVPDLADARHTIRIKYDPNFDENAVLHPSFQTNGFTSWFLENGDFAYGGDGDWGTGFGLLYVYLDDMYSPIITTPLNLEKTLQLDEGRMYVGITAATGNAHWQVHDLLGFQFSSLYIDQKYTPPQVVNGEGAKDCSNYTVCTNFPDFDHYMRTNNIWGKGHDSTESYQTGGEGFCATC